MEVLDRAVKMKNRRSVWSDYASRDVREPVRYLEKNSLPMKRKLE